MTKITNLQAVDGAYFDVVDNTLRYFSGDEGDFGLPIDTPDKFEWHEVKPEYKVGDVVKLKDRDGDLVKGFIYWDSDYTKHERYAIAVVNQYTIDVSKISLLSDIGGFELVGLWVESGETK